MVPIKNNAKPIVPYTLTHCPCAINQPAKGNRIIIPKLKPVPGNDKIVAR